MRAAIDLRNDIFACTRGKPAAFSRYGGDGTRTVPKPTSGRNVLLTRGGNCGGEIKKRATRLPPPPLIPLPMKNGRAS